MPKKKYTEQEKKVINAILMGDIDDDDTLSSVADSNPTVVKDTAADDKAAEISFETFNISKKEMREYIQAVRSLLDGQGLLNEDEYTFEEAISQKISNAVENDSKIKSLKNLKELEQKRDKHAKNLANTEEEIARSKAIIMQTAAAYDANRKSKVNEKLTDEELEKLIKRTLFS